MEPPISSKSFPIDFNLFNPQKDSKSLLMPSIIKFSPIEFRLFNPVKSFKFKF